MTVRTCEHEFHPRTLVCVRCNITLKASYLEIEPLPEISGDEYLRMFARSPRVFTPGDIPLLAKALGWRKR